MVGYWLLFGRIPTVTPQEAKQRSPCPEDPPWCWWTCAGRSSFPAGHIDGAVNWPLAAILAIRNRQDLPAALAGKTLLLVCDVGMASREAAWHLETSIGMNGRGHSGMDSQRGMSSRGDCRLPTAKLAARRYRRDALRWTRRGHVGEFPFRASPVLEQAAAVIAYFFFKPIYMILSVVVGGCRLETPESDLVALRWGMVFFFLGEAACAVNYFGYRETSYLWEYLHGLGMLSRSDSSPMPCWKESTAGS